MLVKARNRGFDRGVGLSSRRRDRRADGRD
jgi:hypothetical protein